MNSNLNPKYSKPRRETVYDWVKRKASVTRPYGKYYSASVTLGMDINETGATIEEAWNKLTNTIFNSSYRMEIFTKLKH